jgi:hypothetical protein
MEKQQVQELQVRMVSMDQQALLELQVRQVSPE